MGLSAPAACRGEDRLLKRRRPKTVWLLPAVLLLWPSSAQAYVDPGAGTMIWQMLVAGFLGAVFYLRRLIPGWRAKKSPREGDPTPARTAREAGSGSPPDVS